MNTTYDPKITALLFCIDFLQRYSKRGRKSWGLPWVEGNGEKVNLLDNGAHYRLNSAKRQVAKIYHVPHHRWEPGDYVDWKYPSPYQLGAGGR